MTDLVRLPRILITNDDGIDAPGLVLLTEIAQEFTDEIWVIAPEHEQSGTGQARTLDRPLRCWPRGERRWAVTGTPGDCVIIALAHFMKDNKPSLILSGINPGDNTGDAVNLSGTLGAAFMGLMMGTPSIGISQAHKHGEETRWDTARAIAPIMLRHFLTYGWKKDTCLSINIPNLPAEEIPGFTWAKQSLKNAVELRVDVLKDTSDELYYWERHFHQTPSQDHSDWTVLQRGHVAVTALGLDRSIDVREPPVLFDEAVTDEPADE